MYARESSSIKDVRKYEDRLSQMKTKAVTGKIGSMLSSPPLLQPSRPKEVVSSAYPYSKPSSSYLSKMPVIQTPPPKNQPLLSSYTPVKKEYFAGSDRFREELPKEMPKVERRPERKDEGLGGLSNIGNTCFLNSTLQCLFNLPQLNQALGKASGKEVLAEYLDLYRKTRESSSSCSTYSLKRALASRSHRFAGFAQEDAHQFFITLVNTLHEECNRVRTKPKYEELKSYPDYEKGGQIWWNYMRKIDDSVVYDCLLGQLLSVVECEECREKSVAFDEFLSLELNVKSGSYSYSAQTTLLDLIKEFLAVERISSFRCEKEKRTTRCKRQMSLWRLPSVLVVHLKRFEFSGYYRRKIETRVSYPEELDLRGLVSESKHESMQQPVYRLVGVIKHMGSIDGGHYTAEAVGRSGQWYEFNDSSVHRTQPTLQGSTPYILFYARRDYID